jgi:alkylation response protein AidB-like acyl-CoA dehydrogenase
VDQLSLGGAPESQPETGHWPLPAWWKQLGQLGALSVAWPEAQGGIGAGALGHGQMMYSLARGIKGQAYLASVVLGGGALLASSQGAHAALLAKVGAGEAMVAFAHGEAAARGDRHVVQTCLAQQADGGWRLSGRKSMVLVAPWAGHAVVSARVSGDDGDADGLALALVPLDAPGVRQRAFKTIDGACASELAFDDVAVGASDLIGTPGQAAALIDELLDQATLALSAEVLGLTERMLDATLAHLRQRTQFGKPLASFQVLQHRMVEMYNIRALSMALTRRALRDASGDAARRGYEASAAMLIAGQAAREVGEGAVQLHGAMGVTEELAAGHYFRRGMVLVQQLGSPDWHAGRCADWLRG